jgi:4-amino-4-deoxy-L-arabinose transferase-like glycosyltransferase
MKQLSPWLFILAMGGVYAALARLALHSFPYSGDEYSMLLQAEGFARGVLHAPAPPHAELFRVDHVLIDPWVRSKYPPGAAALFALGVRAGVPWLVTPVVGMITLALTFFTARRELGASAAWVTLVVLALAPLFVVHSATFFSHAATTMWLALAFASLSEWSRGRRDGWLGLVGLGVGCAFLTRPADAVFFGAAMLVLRSARAIALTLLAVVPFFALNLAYQAAQFGAPFKTGYAAYDPTLRAIYGGTPGYPLSLSNLLDPVEAFLRLDVCRAFAIEWTLAGTVLLAVFGAYAVGRDHPARAMRNFAAALVAVFLVTFMAMGADPDDGARPRFLSTLLLPVGFLAGPGWLALREVLRDKLGKRTTIVVAAIAVLFAPAQVASYLMQRLPLQWEREGLYDAVAREHVSEGVVVIRARYPTRYARNGMFFDRPVLYLSAPRTMTVAEVAQIFPGRAIYEATEGAPWTIDRRL